MIRAARKFDRERWAALLVRGSLRSETRCFVIIVNIIGINIIIIVNIIISANVSIAVMIVLGWLGDAACKRLITLRDGRSNDDEEDDDVFDDDWPSPKPVLLLLFRDAQGIFRIFLHHP